VLGSQDEVAWVGTGTQCCGSTDLDPVFDVNANLDRKSTSLHNLNGIKLILVEKTIFLLLQISS